MSLPDVERWFMQLVKKGFLTEEQVNLFIDKAFRKKEGIEMLTAKLKDSDLEVMGALFRRYYTRCIELYHALQRGNLKEYTGLLTKNFTNYAHLDDSLPTNFSKYDKRMNAWSDTI